jgi:hypothetical protein
VIDPAQLDSLQSRSDLVQVVRPIIEALSVGGYEDEQWTDNALAEFVVACCMDCSCEEGRTHARALLQRFPHKRGEIR